MPMYARQPYTLWATTNEYRAQNTYIDEMIGKITKQIEDEIERKICEEILKVKTYNVTTDYDGAITATTTTNIEFDNDALQRVIDACGLPPQVFAKVEIEPEDVDVNEFERILNGG